MARRRPPGAGAATAIFTLLLALPWISSAAQQQQPSHSAHIRSEREARRYVDAITDNSQRQPNRARAPSADAAKPNDNPYTPLFSEDERAVATKISSAPANFAVRAPLARNAAPSGAGGLTPKSARSLQDWEVEDFVLLATVDGRIHARDRYNGNMIWTLDVTEPMLKTTYNTTHGDVTAPQNQPFLWIVEPKEDGALYILTPGPHPVLSSLGLTVRELAEMSPYVTEEPPIVYLADKKHVMLVVDARTGDVVRSFSTSGAVVLDPESCVAHKPNEVFDESRRECKGLFNIGRTEYTVSIQNQLTGELICTITYSEWTPNIRDRDLRAQYRKTMDDQYIYSRYDGRAIAMDHRRARAAKRPVFEQKFPAPVVRVFDVARPNDIEDTETSLVMLPQPRGPSFLEEKANRVWLNTTEDGSWYALSENNYPVVTDQAPLAPCYAADWIDNVVLNDHTHILPTRQGLVGVHLLDHIAQTRPIYPGIEAPSETPRSIIPIPQLPDRPSQEPENTSNQYTEHAGSSLKARSWLRPWVVVIITLMVTMGSAAYIAKLTPQMMEPLFSKFRMRLVGTEQAKVRVPTAEAQADVQPPQEAVPPIDVPVESVDVPVTEPEQAPTNPDVDHEKKVVRFQIPEDDEDLEPLSRTTTAEPFSPEDAQPSGSAEAANDQTADPATPTKKKKAHRGRRGGAKKNKKLHSETDDITRIVDVAKNLERGPTLLPDEVTLINGDISQDVSTLKRIGKLTVDYDRMIGNGSGGTCVFMGTWNDREVAIKRMLPLYNELALQEVKLLQESDLHPNVIRFFDHEKDENFLYIAVELCQASLFDLFKDGRSGNDFTDTQRRLANEINADVPSALRQLAAGLYHLHNLRIIHRDIKPQNILIAHPSRGQPLKTRLVISDFGLCKTLPDNVSTLVGTTGNAGTVGWKAPELISQPNNTDRGSSTGHSRDSSSSQDPVAQGVKRAVDIFSLGCVFFYVLTNGSHPFDDEEGWMQVRELNIKKNKANLEQLSLGDDSEEPRHLIRWMLENRPEDRPTAWQVIIHPFFWTAELRLDFLCDCSDHWERECRDPPSPHLIILESYSQMVISDSKGRSDFLAKLNRAFVASLGKQRKYTGDRMLDLLRALRNKKNHYEDMDDSVKAMVGPLPEGYLRYWTVRFPRLLMACYECVRECGLEGEPRFKRYFSFSG